MVSMILFQLKTKIFGVKCIIQAQGVCGIASRCLVYGSDFISNVFAVVEVITNTKIIYNQPTGAARCEWRIT